MARNKSFPDFDTAVADIPDGAVIAIGGFAGPGTPYNLIAALARHGAKRLTCIANTTGGAHKPRMPDIGMLVENGQVAKVICAFTAATRASDVIPFTKYYEAGEVEAEIVPQGTLAERLRAAGAGIPACCRYRIGRRTRNTRDQWKALFAGICATRGLRLHSRRTGGCCRQSPLSS